MLKSKKGVATLGLSLGVLFFFLHGEDKAPKRAPSSFKSGEKIRETQGTKSFSSSPENSKKEVSSKPTRKMKEPHSKRVELKSQKALTKRTYKKMADFPDYSTPLNPSQSSDFIADRFQKEVQEASSVENPGLSVLSWTSKNFYTKEDTVILKIRLLDKGKTAQGSVRGRIKNGLNLQFQHTRKGLYKAEIPAKDLSFGHHMVKIEAAFSGEKIKSLNQFKVMKTYYSFRGVSGDELDQEGNLIFHADFDIKERGAYLLEGTLYKDGKIVAIAEKALRLNSGAQTIPLKFHGYIFYKRKIDGPFELKNLQLSHIDENLESDGNAKLLRPQFVSQSLSWDQFNNQPYRNETIGRKLRELESSR